MGAAENPEPSSDTAAIFNDILSPLAFRAPEALRRMPTWQEHIPFAFWLMERARPRVVVELGTFTGSSYLAFCQAVQALELPARCYGIDTWSYGPGPRGDQVYRDLVDYHDPRYAAFSRLIRGTFDQARAQFEDGTVDLLHIDGRHSYEAVRHDFESWRPKLSSRAVVLFHDSNVRGFVAGEEYGVFKLWSELTAVYPDNFQFFHCDGLAVLGVGSDLPAVIRRFFAVARSPASAALIRNVYGRLGSHCSTTSIQLFTRELLQDSLAAQSVPGEFDGNCGAKFDVFAHSVRWST